MDVQLAGGGVYDFHGLRVRCPFPAEDLRPADGEGPADVEISFGDLPDALFDQAPNGVVFERSSDEHIWRVPGIASFRVTEGRQVEVFPSEMASVSDVAAVLFGAVFGVLLLQRGCLVLHAGAVEGPNGAVLVTGHSGAGKSTVLAALASIGFSTITDDVANVFVGSDDRAYVHTAGSRVKLWSDAIDRLGLHGAKVARVRPSLDKFYVRVKSSPSTAPVPIVGVCALDVDHRPGWTSRTVDDARRFEVLARNTRLLRLTTGKAFRARHFSTATAVANRVPMVEIVRPKGVDSANAIAVWLAETWLG